MTDKMAQNAQGTKVMMTQVANGSFTQVQVRSADRRLLCVKTYISHEHALAEQDYARQCEQFNAQ
jgi:hypothetical protein